MPTNLLLAQALQSHANTQTAQENAIFLKAALSSFHKDITWHSRIINKHPLTSPIAPLYSTTPIPTLSRILSRFAPKFF